MEDVPLSSLIIVLMFCVLFSGFFSATETAYSTCNKIRLRQMANRGNKRAESVLDFCETYDKLISTILVGNNFVNILATTVSTVLFTAIFFNNGPSISTAFMTIVILLFGEITPKTIAKEYADEFAMFAYPLLKFIFIILTPFTFIFNLWQKLIMLLFKSSDKQGMTGEELITMIEEVEKDGNIEKEESKLIRSAIEFSDVDIEDIYTPRVDVIAVDIEDTLDEITEKFEENHYSRLPIYKDTIDNIIGFIHQRDFYELDKEHESLESIIQTPLYLPLTTPISDALKQLQKSKVHLAVVCDEFGGTAGIITLEDIIEELVGEIWDEHDEVVDEVIQIDEKTYKIAGTANIDDIFDLFHLYEEDIYTSNTLSGWIIEFFEKVPSVGDEFDFKTMHISILEADDRKITWVQIKEQEIQEENDKSEKE